MERKDIGCAPSSTPRESVGDRRDNAGDAREVAGTRRDRVGEERDAVGDERDRDGAHRDRLADRRDREGDKRDEFARVRDVLAEKRDRAGVHRDQVADHRDEEAERFDARTGSSDRTGRGSRRVTARHEAAADRVLASEDRAAGARERALTRADRHTAVGDRSASAAERSSALTDRDRASDDRTSGAAERSMSEEDRASSHADRVSSAAERRLYYLDELTGVYSRGAGLIELRREIDRCHRRNHSLVLAFVDADHLKATNDGSGHAAGDRLLTGLAAALVANLRSYDVIMRYGGDEFVCAMSNVSTAMADERLQLAAGTSAASGGGFTYGLAELSPGDTAETLVARADAAFYGRRRQRGESIPG